MKRPACCKELQSLLVALQGSAEGGSGGCLSFPRTPPGQRAAAVRRAGAHVEGDLCMAHLLPLAFVVLRYSPVQLTVGLLQL